MKKDSEIALYINKLCDLLIQYYQCDYVTEELNKLLEKKKEIENFFTKNILKEIEESPRKFSSFLLDEIKNHLPKPPSIKSSSKIRGQVSALITNRSYWNYSRTFANYLIIYFRENGFYDFIKEYNEKIGLYYTPDDLIKVLEQPQDILRALGVGLYAVRFMINFFTILKHVVQAAMNKKLSSKKVLVQELEKRAYIMTNDMIWGTVSLLSNYNKFFNLTSLTVAQLNLTFLGVDVALFIIRWLYENRQYEQHINELLLQKNNLASPLEWAVIDRQLDILQDEREVQCAYYVINIVAANLLVLAYAASLLLSGPLALACLASASMLGNALYNSCEEYKKYKQASIAVKRETANGKILDDKHHHDLLKELTEECAQAHSDYWKTLIYNTTATAFIITAAAISWPIACVLTIAYIGHRFIETYQKYLQTDNKNQITHDIYRLFRAEESAISPPKLNELSLNYLVT
ncbi:hypothetical protein [Legionella cardiaca]|uniref:Coiled-coil protein n=1 Tax=Legionella cardiaca TaxID=1071983 RepID=A0ABY8AZM9_9GAMM|nr:hypothetical protein [Legionella cardiaca]WED44577.1 hypothetical protein PXX05_07255 [Legionella cardiaca]